jgi:2-polyprenyl-3-methyl-5-hydroxy-6-metoxy-1,4-benzoquinol methylase
MATTGSETQTKAPCEVCSGKQFSTLFEKEGHTFVRCSACRLERIDPAPSDETLSAIYGDHYYDAWGLRTDEQTVARLKKATFSDLLDRLPPPKPGARLLDCGAATGFLLEVAKERGYVPYAVEFGELGAKELVRKFGAEHVFRGEIDKAHFADAKDGDFQVITMCDYIEHVRDPAKVLERAAAMLAPGGILAITTPDAGSFSHATLRSGWTHYKIEHLHYFSQSNLARLLERCGFASVKFHPLAKSLSVGYIRQMFEVYPHPVLSRAASVLGRVIPEGLQSRRLRLPTGEMFAVASRA